MRKLKITNQNNPMVKFERSKNTWFWSSMAKTVEWSKLDFFIKIRDTDKSRRSRALLVLCWFFQEYCSMHFCTSLFWIHSEDVSIQKWGTIRHIILYWRCKYNNLVKTTLYKESWRISRDLREIFSMVFARRTWWMTSEPYCCS
jgi:hypothetical protein